MRTKLEFCKVLTIGLSVALCGGVLLWQLTGGLQLFTSEAWRRAAMAQSPRSLPDVTLQDHRGRMLQLRDLCGKPMLIDFVYTQCPTVCKALGAASAQLADRLNNAPGRDEAVVLSISFDPIRDTPDRMSAFKKSLESHDTDWMVARPRTDIQPLLSTFGVVVIPDGMGGFEHNAALHAVDRSCRVARVFDLDEVGDAEQWIRARF